MIFSHINDVCLASGVGPYMQEVELRLERQSRIKQEQLSRNRIAVSNTR